MSTDREVVANGLVGYLRLDFSWNQALSLETRSEIEEVANQAIRHDLAVSAQFMSVPEAKEWGAVALFGETYDESVRVVQVGGPWSRELCGGTHVSRSSQIGLLALSGESSVGSGSRRLEALVGIEAFRSLATERALVARLMDAMKSPKDQLEARLEASLEELKIAKSKLASLSAAVLNTRVPEFAAKAENLGETRFVSAELDGLESADDLRSFAASLQKAIGGNGVAVAFAVLAEKPAIVVAVGEALRAQGIKAGALVKLASAVLGGGGGGKDDIAQGGGVDASKLTDAIKAIREALG